MTSADQPPAASEVIASVKQWTQRVKSARAFWEPQFERMRENMDFAAGLQWNGQKNIRDEKGRYVVNLALSAVLHKMSQLYARNPTVDVYKRKRMDFALWDESVHSLQDAMQRLQMGRQMGFPDLQAEALMQDFMQGRAMQKMVNKVCQTLKIGYQYQVDEAQPDFKEQLKDLVLRTIICGVGYCIPSFVRESAEAPSTIMTAHTDIDRAKLAKMIVGKIQDGEIPEGDPLMETLKQLLTTLHNDQGSGGEEYQLSERIEFDFPPSTSIIPDTRIRSLKDFINARWVAQEFLLPLDEVNAMFGTDVPQSSTITNYNNMHQEARQLTSNPVTEIVQPPLVCLWRVWDITTKVDFFVLEGYDNWVREPQTIYPCVSGFWPLQALVFNNTETVPGIEASPFPPSDIDNIFSACQEWNRVRDALRDQRNANAPTPVARKGLLTENDKIALNNRKPNHLIELEGLPNDMEPGNAISMLQVAKIDPGVYDTAPLEQDIMVGGGMQQANIGPAQPDVTATVGTIAEQSRLSVTGEDVDALDGFLTRIARSGGEMMFQEFSLETMQRIVGRGAVWPTDPLVRADFLNSIKLKIVAASSGRPNKAMDLATMREIMPLLLQFGANPIACIEKLVKFLGDDQIDVQEFYPIPGMDAAATGPAGLNNSNGAVGQSQGATAQPAGPASPPLQLLPNGAAAMNAAPQAA